ncbi:hypothetical protein I4U23_007998 [Adineta vaga]|nr:hypothetical protein I4U23_007998 [Adineta vaga]
MSSNYIELPHEAIRLILLHCQTPKDYLSQSLVNRQWLNEARRLKLMMKTRFVRKISIWNYRFIMWNFDVRVTVIGNVKHLERHGLEECSQTYHRVGGPSSSVYYLERYWQEGQLHGLEILREINEIWHTKYYRRHTKETSDDIIIHPYDGLKAVDSMRKYGRHVLVPKNSMLPEGCDHLGKIIFKRRWILGILKESEELEKHEIDESDYSSIYDLLDSTNLYGISS